MFRFRSGCSRARLGSGCLLVASTVDLISGRFTTRVPSGGACCDDRSYDTTSKFSSNQTPERLTLQHVIVMHRHGDRAPVTKSIGPKYPHSKEDEDIWMSKLVSGDKELLLKAIAKQQSPEEDGNIYSGRDSNMTPYGQLTDVGLEQLIDVGRKLRRDYREKNSFLPEELNGDVIYARSTNTCRTMNSLRGLLIGLYGLENAFDMKDKRFPLIESFPAGFDPMIDSPTNDLREKDEIRKHIIKQHKIPTAHPTYKLLNEKMKGALGYTDRVNWLVIREQLVCAQSHKLPFPKELDDSDLQKIYELEMWMVKTLFGDRHYNAHAIGAFYSEIRDRILDIAQEKAGSQKLSVYSGHDYTLIPFMVGLGILPDEFPHYAATLIMEIATSSAVSSSSVVPSVSVPVLTSTSTPSPEATETTLAVPATPAAVAAAVEATARPLTISNKSTPNNKKETFVRFLYNGEEIRLPGCDSVWVPVAEVSMRLLEGATGHHRDQLGDADIDQEEEEGIEGIVNGEGEGGEDPADSPVVLTAITTGVRGNTVHIGRSSINDTSSDNSSKSNTGDDNCSSDDNGDGVQSDTIDSSAVISSTIGGAHSCATVVEEEDGGSASGSNKHINESTNSQISTSA